MEGCVAGFLAACSQKDRAVGGPRNARPAETALLCKRGTPETQIFYLHINKILRTARILSQARKLASQVFYLHINKILRTARILSQARKLASQVFYLHINKILRTARILFILIQNSFFHFAVFYVDEADEKTYFVVFVEP